MRGKNGLFCLLIGTQDGR